MLTGELTLRVHDLILLSSAATARVAEDAICRAQPWVADVLNDHPWVVVRRVTSDRPEDIAVGVRGPQREQRWAAQIPREEVLGVISPEGITATGSTYPDKPAFRALACIEAHGLDAAFGPGGSVGFELATGKTAVRDSSDLDLVVQASEPLTDDDILTIDATVTAASVHARVDVLIETPFGAVAFAELRRAVGLNPRPAMVLRTPQGPRLVTDPWEEP